MSKENKKSNIFQSITSVASFCVSVLALIISIWSSYKNHQDTRDSIQQAIQSNNIALGVAYNYPEIRVQSNENNITLSSIKDIKNRGFYWDIYNTGSKRISGVQLKILGQSAASYPADRGMEKCNMYGETKHNIEFDEQILPTNLVRVDISKYILDFIINSKYDCELNQEIMYNYWVLVFFLPKAVGESLPSQPWLLSPKSDGNYWTLFSVNAAMKDLKSEDINEYLKSAQIHYRVYRGNQ